MIKVSCESMREVDYPVGIYIHENKDSIDKLIKLFVSIDEFRDKQVNILCQGSSGSIIAAFFAMGIPNKSAICYFNKDGEHRHGGMYGYNLMLPGFVNIIVDDFIGSGATIGRIYNIAKQSNHDLVIHAVCVTGADRVNLLNFEPKYSLSNGH